MATIEKSQITQTVIAMLPTTVAPGARESSRGRFRRNGKAKSQTANGLQQLRFATRREFITQAPRVHVEHVRSRVAGPIPQASSSVRRVTMRPALRMTISRKMVSLAASMRSRWPRHACRRVQSKRRRRRATRRRSRTGAGVRASAAGPRVRRKQRACANSHRRRHPDRRPRHPCRRAR